MNESKADTVIKACELNRKGQAKYFFSRTPTRGPTHTDKGTGRHAGWLPDRHTRVARCQGQCVEGLRSMFLTHLDCSRADTGPADAGAAAAGAADVDAGASAGNSTPSHNCGGQRWFLCALLVRRSDAGIARWSATV